MRCPEVMQELSAPGARPNASLARHLVHCPACTRWAAEVTRLDQIWDETRPTTPDSAQFSQLWNQVCLATEPTAQTVAMPAPVAASRLMANIVDSPTVTERIPFLPRTWRHGLELGLVLTGLAAAALLFFALIPPKPEYHSPSPVPEVVAEAPVALENYESEPGQTLFIQISGANVIAESRPATDVSETITVAAELNILNFMESQSQGAL